MFDFLSKAMSFTGKPTRNALQSALTKNAIFTSLTEQTQKDVLEMLGKVSESDLSHKLQQVMEMTSANRDQVVAKLLHPEQDAAGANTETKSGAETYTVQPGDSLSKIAKAHGKSLKAVIAANPQVKNPDMIHPREVINLN